MFQHFCALLPFAVSMNPSNLVLKSETVTLTTQVYFLGSRPVVDIASVVSKISIVSIVAVVSKISIIAVVSKISTASVPVNSTPYLRSWASPISAIISCRGGTSFIGPHPSREPSWSSALVNVGAGGLARSCEVTPLGSSLVHTEKMKNKIRIFFWKIGLKNKIEIQK